MKARELEKILRSAGWELVPGQGKGSHRVYVHPDGQQKVTVPYHGGRDLPKGTTEGILKQAGLK